MLRALGIRDFVIVDRLDLEFGAGFNVLTGETGAGKSILLDALDLLLGGRAESGLIRPGAERAELFAEFECAPDGAVAAWLTTNDYADAPGELLVRRVVDTSGRSRAAINGRPATLGQLRELTEQLVDIHGQNAHLMLTRAGAQRALLDRFANASVALAAVADAHATWREADASLKAWLASAEDWAARLETLRHDIAELEPLASDPQAIEALEAEHRRLAHAQGLIEAAQAALQQVDEGELNAHDQLAAAAQRIDGVVALDVRLAEALAALQSAEAAAAEAASDLRRYLDRADLDPERLDEVEARLGELQRIARKHRSTPAELPALLETLRAERAQLGGDGEEDAEARLRQRAEAARASYDRLAEALRAQRAPAAQRLAETVTATMQRLSLSGGRFEVLLQAEPEPTAHGNERVEFLVSANAGMPPGPLGRVASGGELSRIGLALSTAGADSLAAGTLVFDEVDAGIGGGVAEVVGRMLQALGGRRQVLCVTHLAQVAACAATQFRVSKAVRDGLASSRVERLDAAARIDELARMIGGVQITDTTRAHAGELLEQLGGTSGTGGPRQRVLLS
ncbi:MAG: DNA repair protein RecN [Rhodocyclaceae bacterium]|nr:DNA repair protein RecN [Rhodocyclaceae bacterium]